MFFDGMKRAAEGMIALSRLQDIITNNLANVSTAGYQADTMIVASFGDLFEKEMHKAELMGGFEPARVDDTPELYMRSVTRFQQGTLKQTDHPFDLALQGKGFFVIETPRGTMYTRNGAFTVDAQGRLMTKDGGYVMGQKGPIVINGKDFEVKEDGTVVVDGKVVDKLLIVDFDNYSRLEKVGTSYFKAPIDLEPKPAEAKVRQGYLEMANVNPIKEMVNMLTVLRSYEMSQKVIQSEDQMLKKYIEQVARVRM